MVCHVCLVQCRPSKQDRPSRLSIVLVAVVEVIPLAVSRHGEMILWYVHRQGRARNRASGRKQLLFSAGPRTCIAANVSVCADGSRAAGRTTARRTREPPWTYLWIWASTLCLYVSGGRSADEGCPSAAVLSDGTCCPCGVGPMSCGGESRPGELWDDARLVCRGREDAGRPTGSVVVVVAGPPTRMRASESLIAVISLLGGYSSGRLSSAWLWRPAVAEVRVTLEVSSRENRRAHDRPSSLPPPTLNSPPRSRLVSHGNSGSIFFDLFFLGRA